MTDSPTLEAFSLAVADATPAPAGGAVAATTAALAAALVTMVGRLGGKRATAETAAGFGQMADRGETLRARLLELATEDARAYAEVLAAKRATEGTELERAARVQAAWRGAVRVPVDVVRHCREVAQLARRAAREGPASMIGDAVMAALLATAVAAGSAVNARLNLQAAGRPEQLRVLVDETEITLREAQRAAADARLALEERLRELA